MYFSGIVKKNIGRGKTLGFSTANLEVGSEAREGVYLGKVGDYNALIFIGAAKTFDMQDKHLEIHLLDFQGELYGQRLTVKILKKIREVKKFKNAEELIRQIKEDEKLAREYFLNV